MNREQQPRDGLLVWSLLLLFLDVFSDDDVVLLFGRVQDVDVVTVNSDDVVGEEDRTTNQLTEEGKMRMMAVALRDILCPPLGAPFYLTRIVDTMY